MNINKSFSLLLISMMIASTLVVAVPRVRASPTDLIVVPPLQEFGPAPCVGTHFTITVEVHDVVNMYGVDIQFGWDIAWIRYVDHQKHIPVETYPDGVLHSPTVPVKDVVDETGGLVPPAVPETLYWLAEASMTPAAPFTGSGIAFDMEFVIVDQPSEWEGEPDVTTILKITASTLANDLGDPIPHTVYDGTVIIRARPMEYPPVPLLKIEPPAVSGIPLCSHFVSEVWLTGNESTLLDPFWDVAGFDIYYNFDPTLIEAVTVTVDPDGWFASFWPGGLFIVKEDIDNIAGTVWIVFLGLPGSLGEHTAPFGEGRLFTVEFHAIMQSLEYPPPWCPLTLDPVVIASYPHPERLYPPWRGSESAVPLTVGVWSEVEHGQYTALYLAPGPAIDAYTQYPDPFGGQGPDEPSDMFWPQKEVIVYAKVTYGGWPEQNKDVAFEVRDNHEGVWAIFYNRTDASGIAWVRFRLPWPCDSPDDYLGEWTITASTDVACQHITDRVRFKYDYLAIIVSVTTNKLTYKHCEDILVTIVVKSQSMMPRMIVITVTIVDDSGVPFAFVFVVIVVSGARYCTYNIYIVSVSLHVVKFARPGIAKIYVSSLTTLPWYAGVPAGPLYEPTPTIGIEAA